MSVSGIQGFLLEVTVVACNKLKDTEWFSRQDPYVCLEYASTKFRTRTCTDGGRNPTFQEKFVFTLIEGLRELNVVVWNRNTITNDDFIGSGKVQLYKVLSQGYDDSPWTLQTKTGRYAGEVRLILHYPNANKSAKSHAPSAPPYVTPPYVTPPAPQTSLYSTPPPVSTAPYPQHTGYPAPSPYPSYPSNSGGYPPSSYPPPQPAAYPPPPYPPTSAYPASPYPPPPQASPYYPPGPFPGLYPPPPY
ncbi:C2 domain-containing protein [Morus notabilis]|uniref:C2 domain-containing protein n=1 Tax=Morus notabilis TaxID=981085 RepID=W9S8P6_9ROSA|nr:C2 domain-containing protein At1g63220 [Morus notabilis]EXC17261.1 C2 domain-containing protein [Morus notabilis]